MNGGGNQTNWGEKEHLKFKEKQVKRQKKKKGWIG
jgi:hypothetical protein